ncbi:hypothetical protein M011DRAFT_478689 [Sporormia fimetaria CBS 119925]|uniref:Uncharacterized protein n=1 Tax=Sporormia fimetaria CBS 119925 TaxID=1340428 RepID=A0A6A6V9F7_9PLEO|nr:hypothetical protein M011DRAFT_478689 [Sporormia fimetaria CBS 119925]
MPTTPVYSEGSDAELFVSPLQEGSSQEDLRPRSEDAATFSLNLEQELTQEQCPSPAASDALLRNTLLERQMLSIEDPLANESVTASTTNHDGSSIAGVLPVESEHTSSSSQSFIEAKEEQEKSSSQSVIDAKEEQKDSKEVGDAAVPGIEEMQEVDNPSPSIHSAPPFFRSAAPSPESSRPASPPPPKHAALPEETKPQANGTSPVPTTNEEKRRESKARRRAEKKKRAKEEKKAAKRAEEIKDREDVATAKSILVLGVVGSVGAAAVCLAASRGLREGATFWAIKVTKMIAEMMGWV